MTRSLDTTTTPAAARRAHDGDRVSRVAGDAVATHGERLPGELQRARRRRPALAARRRSVRGRHRPRLVHRPAHRHRHDAGAGLPSAAVVGVSALDALALRGVGPATGGGRVLARLDGRAARRGVRRAAIERGAPRSGAPDASRRATSRLLVAADRAARAVHPATAPAAHRRGDPAPLGDRDRPRRRCRRPGTAAGGDHRPAGARRAGRRAPARRTPSQPLYVRRPDAEIAREAARAGRERRRLLRWSRSTTAARPRRRPRGRGSVVHQPVDARHVRVGAAEPGRLPHLRGPHRRSCRWPASARSGWWSTRSTSTTWPFGPRSRRGLGTALLRRVLDEARRLGARARDARSAAHRTTAARRLYERAGIRCRRRRGRDYYTNPIEDALILWRDDLTVGYEQRLESPSTLCYVAPGGTRSLVASRRRRP